MERSLHGIRALPPMDLALLLLAGSPVGMGFEGCSLKRAVRVVADQVPSAIKISVNKGDVPLPVSLVAENQEVNLPVAVSIEYGH